MYDHKTIDKKWQKIWKETKIYKISDKQDKPKYYVLDMFPYPSGAGLHVGHPKGYIATDVYARFKMMNGFNVLHPMGWDAFGLPAENYAIKNKIHPKVATEENVKRFKKQLEILGFTYDWEREINTTDPNYYKWTQWIFLQMFKRGLAYQSCEPINWCPSCKTGLANEDLEDGKCERCGSEIEQKPMRQWVLKITDYAEQLLDGLKDLDWEDSIIEMQKNWIGRSEGATVKFKVKSQKSKVKDESQTDTGYKILDIEYSLEVFTTRPDTLFGCTYMVVCPEHDLISNIQYPISNINEVQDYIKKAKNKTNLERADLAKEKTGVEIKGIKAINPVTNIEIPIFVADYVLAGYGTGAIMAVPAHDERDFEFAKKYGLPIKEVVKKNLRTNCLTVHGSPQTDKTKNQNYIPDNINHWIGWLKEQLEYNDYEIFNPQMPTPWKPDYNEWKKQVEKLDINENSILVGHSAGGAFLVRWLCETKQKIDKLILVSAGKEVVDDCSRLRDLYGFDIDPELKNRINKTIIFVSDDEKEYRIRNAKLYEKELNGKLFMLQNRGHFTIKDNPINSQFPELLEQILQSDCFSGEGININSEFPEQILDNTKTPENSEAFDNNEDCCPRCKTTVCHLDNNIIYNKNKNVKLNNSAEPVEGLEPSGQQVTNRGQHHATGTHTPTELYQKNKNITKSLNGLPTREAKQKMIEWLEENSIGKREINYKLRDWVFSRQRYWGEPIPLVYCENCKKRVGEFIQNTKTPENSEAFDDEDFHPRCKLWSCHPNTKSILYNNKNVKLNSIEPAEGLEPSGFGMTTPNLHHAAGASMPTELYQKNKNFTKGELLNPGWIADENLPLELPEVENYKPSGTGESPLANITEWVNTTCPKCGGPAKRETNTMPQWAGSCWYYLRYIDPKNNEKLVDPEKEKYWQPVDLYVGGAEHATRHLIYSRFWHRFLFDIGVVSTPEPFTKLQHVGLIMAEDGRKMSKRWNNVINPDDVVEKYGADAMRVYEMFMGPFDNAIAWSTEGLIGARRFLERVWKLKHKINPTLAKGGWGDLENKKLEPLLHKTIKKITNDIQNFKFNTAISSMMILLNSMECEEKIDLKYYLTLIQLLSPFAPHITEELWNELGNKDSIFKQSWPTYDESLINNEEIKLVIQINGKIRDKISASADITEEEAKEIALNSEKIQQWLDGKEPKKIIFVKGRLVSIVV